MNFVKKETLKKCEFCQKWGFQNMNFRPSLNLKSSVSFKKTEGFVLQSRNLREKCTVKIRISR